MNDDRIDLTEDGASVDCHAAHAADQHEQVRRLGRRELLTGAAAGALGVGLLGVPSAFGQERGCPQVLRFSKDLHAHISEYECTRCVCTYNQTRLSVFRIRLEFQGSLKSSMICDETADMIPDESSIASRLRITLRGDRCPESDKLMLWGYHEGDFKLHHPKLGRVFTGALLGTHGVDPRVAGQERCCWPYGSGLMRGRGIERMEDCLICSSYVLKIPLNPRDPCTKTPPKELSGHLDGVLICPCKT
jgi:hypothetical protein